MSDKALLQFEVETAPQSEKQKKDLSHLRGYDIQELTCAALGVVSLIGWSAVLCSFDFFAMMYPSEVYGDVTILFPIPLKFANFVFGLFMDQISKVLTIKQRISGCLGLQAILMVLMPIVSIMFPNKFGLWACMTFCFGIGMTNCVQQGTSVAFITKLNRKSIGSFWVFTANSALAMNFARAVILVIFGDSVKGVNVGTVVYSLLAGCLIFGTIYVFNSFIDSPYCKTALAEIDSQEKHTQNMIQVTNSASQLREQQITEESFNQRVLNSLSKVRYISLCILMNYVITFMLFPGVSIYQKHYTMISSFSWATLLMQTGFNMGDLSGKALSTVPFYNAKGLYCVTASRAIFFFTFLMTVHSNHPFFTNDVFSLVNIFLFGMTNGFLTGGFMQIGPKRAANLDQQDLIAYICVFSLQSGISLGAFLALSLST